MVDPAPMHDAVDQLPRPAPGTKTRGMLRFSHPLLAGCEWPYVVAAGVQDGPRLALLSGVHPAEYPAIEANIRVMRDLDPARLRGQVVSILLVDPPAFLSRTAFVTPRDGKNPNRCFPGDPQGTFADVLADAIYRSVIRPSDYLVDLHGGDLVEALVPFAIYSASGNERVDDVSAGMARVFGLPYVIQHRPQPGLAGMTIQAAAAVGIPGVIAEAGGCGLLTEPETKLLADGVGNVLRHLGLLAGAAPEASGATEIATFTWLASPAEGMWYPAVAVRDRVSGGQPIGRIGSLFGETLAEVTAPHGGVVLFVTTSPAMKSGGILLAIGED